MAWVRMLEYVFMVDFFHLCWLTISSQSLTKWSPLISRIYSVREITLFVVWYNTCKMRGKHNDKTYKYTNMYNDECTTIDTIEIKHI